MKVHEFGRNFLAIFLSVAIHAALIFFLLWQGNFNEQVKIESSGAEPSKPNIEAVMVDQSLIKAQAEKIRQEREEVKRKEEERLRKIEQQAKLMEKQREAEEQRLREIQAKKLAAEKAARDAQIERERIAQEQRKAKEAIRIAEEKAQAAEAKRQQQLADARKAEEAAKQAAEAARKAAEAAKLAEVQRLEAERQAAEAEKQMAEAKRQKAEQEAALKELFNDLESESKSRNSAREQQIETEIDQYGARFKAMIQQKWRKDLLNDNTCILNLRLSPTGYVVNVNKVSGNDAACNTAMTAVYDLEQFPMPLDPDVIKRLRNITLNFEEE